MKNLLWILLCAVTAFSGSLVKKEKVPVEGTTITKMQKVISVIGSKPDTVVSYDTTRYKDTMCILRTYVDTMILSRVDTIKSTGGVDLLSRCLDDLGPRFVVSQVAISPDFV